MTEDRLLAELQGAHAKVLGAQERLDEALARRRELIVDLHAQGWSMRRIAEALDISPTAVANAIGGVARGA